MGSFKTSRYIAISPALDNGNYGAAKYIAMSTTTGAVVSIGKALRDALTTGELEDIPEYLQSQLRDIGMLVPLDKDEYHELLRDNKQQEENSSTYLLTVMPSANCQLGCSYCGQQHRNTTLSERNQNKLIELVRTQVGKKAYAVMHVNWFGGEPLLGFSVIRTLTPRLKAICAAAGMSYEASVVTNGLRLTPSIAEELFRLDVRLAHVTLDGPKSHDETRAYKGGRPTYQKIFDNLCQLGLSSTPSPKLHIRCNVGSTNADDFSQLLREVKHSPFFHMIERIYVHPVCQWHGTINDETIMTRHFAQLELNWLKEMSELGFGVSFLPPRVSSHCRVHASNTTPLVTPDGRLSNCYEAPLSRKELDFGYIGSLGDPAEKRTTALTDLHKEMSRDNQNCGSCNLLPICGGLCEPLYRNGERKCPGFKYNIGQRLIMHAQQCERTSS